MSVLMKSGEKPRIELNSFFDPMYATDPNGYPIFKMLIGGEWVFSSNKELLDVYSPINDSLIARVTKATIEDTERAIDVAYESKSQLPLPEGRGLLADIL